MPSTQQSIADFYLALCRHDWFYSYSDDNNVWRRGEASKNALRAEANGVPIKERMLADFTLHLFHQGPQPDLKVYEDAQRKDQAAQADQNRIVGSRPTIVVIDEAE